ncbi:Uncharacterised protein [uncultured archaeon]|nr:Uncharacterised protein [uncultured archaeon]
MANILIIGAGTIGTYIGTLLYDKGHNVILLGSTKLRKLNEPLLVEKKYYNIPMRIYKIPSEAALEYANFDFVFITSKLYDLHKNLKIILKYKIKTKYLICIQNGLVDKSIYKPYLNGSKFASISVFEGFRLINNQLIASHSKIGWKTDSSEAGKKVSNLLEETGINCSVEKNLEKIKAEKDIMNCSTNLISAIEKKTFYELCKNKKSRKEIDILFDESYNVICQNIKLTPKEKLREKFYEIISNMKHYSSTYQDAISKEKTEINFLNGYIIKLGKKYDIPTPENEKIVKEFIKKYPESI